MSSTTRVGFNVPAVGDFADEIAYYDNNITTYENELPSIVVASLPTSSNYAGRIRALNNAQVANPPSPNMPYDEYVYTGSAWIPYSAAGLQKRFSNANLSDGSSVTSSGAEVFGSVLPGFNQIVVQSGSVVKFMCDVTLANDTPAGNGFGFNGKFNIFINPNSSSQPGPLTSGAVRLSFPIAESDNFYTNSKLDGGLDNFTGDLLYASTTSGTIGVGAYLSCTYAETTSYNFYLHDASIDTGIAPSPISFSTIRILMEQAGTWSA